MLKVASFVSVGVVLAVLIAGVFAECSAHIPQRLNFLTHTKGTIHFNITGRCVFDDIVIKLSRAFDGSTEDLLVCSIFLPVTRVDSGVVGSGHQNGGGNGGGGVDDCICRPGEKADTPHVACEISMTMNQSLNKSRWKLRIPMYPVMHKTDMTVFIVSDTPMIHQASPKGHNPLTAGNVITCTVTGRNAQANKNNLHFHCSNPDLHSNQPIVTNTSVSRAVTVTLSEDVIEEDMICVCTANWTTTTVKSYPLSSTANYSLEQTDTPANTSGNSPNISEGSFTVMLTVAVIGSVLITLVTVVIALIVVAVCKNRNKKRDPSNREVGGRHNDDDQHLYNVLHDNPPLAADLPVVVRHREDPPLPAVPRPVLIKIANSLSRQLHAGIAPPPTSLNQSAVVDSAACSGIITSNATGGAGPHNVELQDVGVRNDDDEPNLYTEILDDPPPASGLPGRHRHRKGAGPHNVELQDVGVRNDDDDPNLYTEILDDPPPAAGLPGRHRHRKDMPLPAVPVPAHRPIKTANSLSRQRRVPPPTRLNQSACEDSAACSYYTTPTATGGTKISSNDQSGLSDALIPIPVTPATLENKSPNDLSDTCAYLTPVAPSLSKKTSPNDLSDMSTYLTPVAPPFLKKTSPNDLSDMSTYLTPVAPPSLKKTSPNDLSDMSTYLTPVAPPSLKKTSLNDRSDMSTYLTPVAQPSLKKTSFNDRSDMSTYLTPVAQPSLKKTSFNDRSDMSTNLTSVAPTSIKRK